MKVLVFGSRGWIAGHMRKFLLERGFEVLDAESRADDVKGVRREIEQKLPDRVLSLIGRTHGPGYSTIDYLELPGKLVENLQDNLFAPLILASICKEKGIHFTYLGTGCIFSAVEPDKAPKYTESSEPDFFGSSYSIVKGFTDRLMHVLNDTDALNVRIRMPITGDMSPRNFITKIVGYERVCSIPNSMTVLPTLLPLMADMIWNKHTGTINLVNPGHISHNDILKMYKTHVDPTFTWKNFTIEEQNEMLLSKRSNNVLDTTQLEALYPNVPRIHEAVEHVIKDIANSH